MLYTEYFAKGIKPDPIYTVSQWADKHRHLPRESSHEHGKYRTSRTPYLKEPMDCLSVHSPVRRVVAMKPTQVGWTELGNNWLFYIADVAPGPCMMVLPTVELAKRHSKSKVAPSLRHMADLQAKIKDVSDKRSGDNLLMKEFPGGFWQFIGANSAAAMRSVSIKYLFKDDLDGWDADIGEGDPSEIIEKRTDAFSAVCKILEVSTPTHKELSRIEKSFLTTDQSYYHVPCPHCKEEQPLEWGGKDADFGVKFTNNDPKTVQYLCKYCHTLIHEYHKTWMLENGIWIPKFPERKLERGFKLNSLYSPLGWVSWEKIVDEFIKKKDRQETLQVWVNTRMGDAFEATGDRPDWVTLKARAETYRVITDIESRIPEKGLFLTGGVDVQKDRLAALLTAWGRGEECWVLFWGEIYGDPELNNVWKELDFLINQGYPHSRGPILHLSGVAVDSGALTQIVYNYVRSRSPKVIATKGMSTPGKPIIGRPTLQDINYKGKVVKKGVKLWPVGTDTAKGIIYPRLRISESGPGMIHFPMGMGDDFYMQMTAEKQVTNFVKGFPRKEWVLPSGSRNEVLDCLVLCMAAAVRAGLNRMPWDRLEESILGEVIKREVEENVGNQHTSQSSLPTRRKKRVVRSNYIGSLTTRS